MGIIVSYIDENGIEQPLSKLLQMDSTTKALTTIAYDHHELHEGSAFTSCRVVTLPGGGLANILLITKDSAKRPHLIFQVVSDAVMTLGLYEAPDYSGGTTLASFNRDRDSIKTAGMALEYDATNDGGGLGTLIWTFKAGANRAVTASEGSVRNEFKLARNQKYLLLCTGSINDNITFLLDWYEHTDK